METLAGLDLVVLVYRPPPYRLNALESGVLSLEFEGDFLIAYMFKSIFLIRF